MFESDSHLAGLRTYEFRVVISILASDVANNFTPCNHFTIYRYVQCVYNIRFYLTIRPTVLCYTTKSQESECVCVCVYVCIRACVCEMSCGSQHTIICTKQLTNRLSLDIVIFRFQ